MISEYPFLIKHDVSLARLSTFAIGGPAKNYIPLTSSDNLVKVLHFLFTKKHTFKIFAGGSNIVFPDKGIKYYLIHLRNGRLARRGNSIFADAGVLLSNVIKLAIRSGLSGLENLSGIPGSIGGAIVGNAGAYGSSISVVVTKVQVWHRGKIFWLKDNDCHFAYRSSIFKQKPYFILRVALKFAKSDPHKLSKISKEIINFRLQKYKPGLKCPGSFFKNVLITKLSPEVLSKINQSVVIAGKIPAGYLLTEVSARRMKVGGIEVSDFHGNLLINNTGNGTAEDVKKLANILKKKVKDKFGITLEEEVRYL